MSNQEGQKQSNPSFKRNPVLQVWLDRCLSWQGLEAIEHRFGGVELGWGRVEIGHAHLQGFVDIPFSHKLRDRLIEAGHAQPHHILPDSGWVKCRAHSTQEVEVAIRLMRLSYLQKVVRRRADAEHSTEMEAMLESLALAG